MVVGAALSALLVWCSTAHWLALQMTEVFGFITGALSVYLTVKENIWLWPTGIANNLFFAILFWHTRLYADFALQVVYVVLSLLGWYWWLFGGEAHAIAR